MRKDDGIALLFMCVIAVAFGIGAGLLTYKFANWQLSIEVETLKKVCRGVANDL